MRAAVALRGTAVLAALAGIWAVAAWLLWRSTVPGSLHLPRLDEHRFFTASTLESSGSFGRVTALVWVLSTLVQLVVLSLYAWRGARFTRESAAGPIGTGMLLGMIGFALVWAARVPVALWQLWWERRHRLSHASYASYVFGDWVSLAVQFAFLCLALAVVMGFARLVGRHWWLAATPVFVGLAALFSFVGPWLLGTHGLRDPALQSTAVRLERVEHVARTPIVVDDVHDVTSLPNAEATGFGPSRRVVLWDTLLDGRFTERQLAVVVAHELGHLRRGHLWKYLGWYALFAFPGAFLVERTARRRGGIAQPEAVPLALLTLVVLGLLALPFENAISRHVEMEADWQALQATRDPSAAAALFRRFVPTTLDEPDPPTWEYLLLENHPTILQRIAMTQAWRRYATSAAQSP